MSESTFTFDIPTAIQLHREGKRKMMHGIVESRFVKAAVYGANDGIVTTFAVVAGVAGAQLSPAVVLILGFANLLADGLSMGIGDYLGERSEHKYLRYQYMIQEWEVKNIPEEERAELREFFHDRGVTKTDSKELADIIQKYPKLWTELGFIEELGEYPELDKALWKSGAITFLGFVTAGALPLIPYLLEELGWVNLGHQRFLFSAIATGIALFSVGTLKTIVTKGKWWKNGLEILLVGSLAAIAAYVIGAFVKIVFGISEG